MTRAPGELAAVDGPGAQRDETARASVEKNGRNEPRYSPKPTARVAMPPDMITKKAAQPKRKPQTGP